jgi:hypothetical protein
VFFLREIIFLIIDHTDYLLLNAIRVSAENLTGLHNVTHYHLQERITPLQRTPYKLEETPEPLLQNMMRYINSADQEVHVHYQRTRHHFRTRPSFIEKSQNVYFSGNVSYFYWKGQGKLVPVVN